jgi:aconitate hydratase
MADMKKDFTDALGAKVGFKGYGLNDQQKAAKGSFTYEGKEYTIKNGSVVIAAITSCTNTSNPDVMLAAGVVAKNAVEKGLSVNPYIKTSLSPGSGVVSAYFNAAGVQKYLDQLGFTTAGYGCMTCIGNSGEIPKEVQDTIVNSDVVAAAVLSGNRNFEGRVHPNTRANYLASPPLVVAYALAGRVDIDFETEPIGKGKDGKDVFLRDIWPTREQVQEVSGSVIKPEMFKKVYGDILKGSARWQQLDAGTGKLYGWDPKSTYIANPPFFSTTESSPKPV